MELINNVEIGERLKSLRASKRIGQVELTEKLGFGSRSMVSDYERGKRTITITSLLTYSEFFHVSVDWILKGGTDVGSVSDPGCREMLEAYNNIGDERLRKLAIRQVEAINSVYCGQKI